MTDWTDQYVNQDILLACADLVERSGGRQFQLGHLHDDVPVEEAAWYAHVTFKGARVTVDNQRSPTAAALALAERLLHKAMCRCRRPVTLSDDADGCRWRLVGPRWEPGCDAEPIHVKGERGDYAAVQAAYQQPMNRAQRRKANKKRR